MWDPVRFSSYVFLVYWPKFTVDLAQSTECYARDRLNRVWKLCLTSSVSDGGVQGRDCRWCWVNETAFPKTWKRHLSEVHGGQQVHSAPTVGDGAACEEQTKVGGGNLFRLFAHVDAHAYVCMCVCMCESEKAHTHRGVEILELQSYSYIFYFYFETRLHNKKNWCPWIFPSFSWFVSIIAVFLDQECRKVVFQAGEIILS